MENMLELKFRVVQEDQRDLDEIASGMPPRMEWQVQLQNPPHLTATAGWQENYGWRVVWRGHRKPSTQLLNALDNAMRQVVLWMGTLIENQSPKLTWPQLGKENNDV